MEKLYDLWVDGCHNVLNSATEEECFLWLAEHNLVSDGCWEMLCVEYQN